MFIHIEGWGLYVYRECNQAAASHIRDQGCYVFTYTVFIGSQFSGPAVTLYWSETEHASLCLRGDVCHCLYMNQVQV